MITSLYAGILGLFYFNVSMGTIKARRSNKVSLGAGPDNEILPMVSAHSNFAAYVPLLLLLSFMAEQGGIHPYLLHAVGIAFTIGRVFHFSAFRGEKMDFKKRVLGMRLTLIPLIVLSMANLFAFVWGQIL